MTYINRKNEYGNNKVETVDEFETYKEAKTMLKEYHMCMTGCYMSSRSTKEWREKK